MRESTKKWVEYAEADRRAAEVQFRHGEKMDHSYQITAFHCHQAIEKVLKAHLVERGLEIIKTHDLTRLRKATGLKFPDKIIADIDEINPHYLQPRYPDLPFAPSFSFTYNRKNTKHLLKQTSDIFIWLEKELPSDK